MTLQSSFKIFLRSREKPEPEVGKNSLGLMSIFPIDIHTSDGSNTIFPISMDFQASNIYRRRHLVGTNRSAMANSATFHVDLWFSSFVVDSQCSGANIP